MTPPQLVLHPNTKYETRPFNFKYEGGNESFSFLVPEVDHYTIQFLLKRPGRDTKADLIEYALQHIGRQWDRERCSGLAIRAVNGRLEVRIQFRAPWYLEESNGEPRSGN